MMKWIWQARLSLNSSLSNNFRLHLFSSLFCSKQRKTDLYWLSPSISIARALKYPRLFRFCGDRWLKLCNSFPRSTLSWQIRVRKKLILHLGPSISFLKWSSWYYNSALQQSEVLQASRLFHSFGNSWTTKNSHEPPHKVDSQDLILRSTKLRSWNECCPTSTQKIIPIRVKKTCLGEIRSTKPEVTHSWKWLIKWLERTERWKDK